MRNKKLNIVSKIKLAKVVLLLFLSLIYKYTTKAQNLEFGLSIFTQKTLPLENRTGVSILPAFNISHKKNTVQVAPSFNIDYNSPTNIFNGVYFNFTNKQVSNKRLSLLLCVLSYYNFKSLEETRTIDYGINQSALADFKVQTNSWINAVGYGVSAKLLSKIDLFSTFYVGLENYNSKTSVSYPNKPELNSTYHSGNIFSGSRTISLIQVGAAYTFSKKHLKNEIK